MKLLRRIVQAAAVLAFSPALFADITLPHVFGDHMVLQAGQPVPVWGWAKPGETITVTFAGQKKETTTAAQDGAWKVDLDPLAISAQAADFTVTGADAVTFHDVLVGEVWLCSGQSNMQKPVGTWRGQPVSTINSEQELAAANYPLIRLMNVEISGPVTPARDFEMRSRPKMDYPWMGWVVCTPASLDQVKFSAVGYFFRAEALRGTQRADRHDRGHGRRHAG